MSTAPVPSSASVCVAIVGAGNVGSTFAYALLLSGPAADIVLINENRAKAEGEAMDLNHAVPFSHPTGSWCPRSSETIRTESCSLPPTRSMC